MWRNGVLAVVVVAGLVGLCQCGSASDWKDRTIYQLLTDRFATADGSSPSCSLSSYCGGKWDGITDHLSYIKGMGFDAIWITPVVKNTDGGYHGYWTQDFYSVNPYFGSEADLTTLVKACHNNNMWVMFDVVGNHVGNVGYDYSSINPFSTSTYYHDCSGCPSSCNIEDYSNQNQVEHCRLAGLPDLDQSNSYVNSTLNSWIKNLVSTYGADGIRIDTVPEVSKSFWTGFQESAGVFGIGEVYDGRVDYVAGYQGYVDSVLSYPMFFTLRGVFQSKNSMYNIESELNSYAQYFSDMSILGNFIDNHDQARFLNGQSDYWMYKNALVYILMSQGIPIVYYGTEQGYSGGSDPNNREPLWTSGYSTTSDLYTFLQTVITYRKSAKVWTQSQVQRYADNNFYAFTRGTTFVALTNGGTNQASITRTITYQPYADGTKLCNLFYPTDCIYVEDGQFDVVLLHGEPKIFYPV
ncbi:acidstable alpha-amylase [Pelomyxa schiedti]|nr:acidstable alpha-amylase [Pelomyxa schiedti]